MQNWKLLADCYSQSAILAYMGLTVGLLVSASLTKSRMLTEATNSGIPSETFRLIDALVFLALSTLEHARSPRSSILLNSYLALTLLFDTVRARTLWLLDPTPATSAVFTVGVASKVLILLLEAQSKTRWISEPGTYSPETTSGIFTLGCFSWLNQLIFHGYNKLIAIGDLFPLDPGLSAEVNEAAFRLNWQTTRGGKKHRLLRALSASLKWQFMLPVIPRIALGFFNFSQPFMISSLLAYLQEDVQTASRKHGYGFIAAAAFVYPGIAVSTALYRYLDQRFLTSLRACLVSSVYMTTTELGIAAPDASSSLTLMDSDVSVIGSGLAILHECWANPIEAAVASWLLYRQIGVAFLAAVMVVLMCMAVSVVIGRLAGLKRRTWMSTLQRRVAMTASAVSNMVSIKISNLAPKMSASIQQSRVEELKATKSLRLLNAIATIAGYGPGLLSPAVVFAFTTNSLTIQRTFTSLAYIQLLCSPLAHLFQIFPIIMSAITSLQRVENFLESGTTEPKTVEEGTRAPPNAFVHVSDNGGSYPNSDIGCDSAVTVQCGQFAWNAQSPLLLEVNLRIPAATLTLITGPVASGKSSLIKALLGEIPVSSGTVSLRDRHSLAFCDQEPFLSKGTIRENVIADGAVDNLWYEEVITATALKDDITALPDGDQTNVGMSGASMSGGQRKRIALARAIYARPRIALLDDVLSGLDRTTYEHVFHSVLGPRGVFKKMGTTVLLATGANEYLSFADHVLVVGNQTVSELERTSGSGQEHVSKSYTTEINDDATPTQSKPKVSRPNMATRSSPQPRGMTVRQHGDVAVYRTYFSRLGTVNVAIFFFSGCVFAFLYNFGIVWLEFWSASTIRGEDRRSYFLGIYMMIQILCMTIMAAYLSLFGMYMAVRASFRTHQELLGTIMAAPLAYFTSVDPGVTTNYFAQDISTIDNGVAMGLASTVLTGITVLAQACVIATSSAYILIGYPILLGLLAVLAKIYLRTSRQLRFLEAEAKAPL